MLRYRLELRYLCEKPHFLAKLQELPQFVPRRGTTRLRRNLNSEIVAPHAAREPLLVSNIGQILKTCENYAAQTDYCR